MYLLDCNANLKPIMAIIGWVVFLLQMGIPIVLILLGMLDLGKAVIASKDDEIKKAQKSFGRRFLYAAAVFLVVWAVRTVLGFLPSIFGEENVSGQNEWESCWACIANRGETGSGCTYSK